MQSEANQTCLKLIYSHAAWKQSIKPTLVKLSQKVLKSYQIIKKFQQFNFFSTTHRSMRKQYIKQYNYKELQSQYGKQLPLITSQMAKIILQYQQNPPKFPMFYQGIQKQHTFTKKQKVLLTSMMFMNLIPDQDFRYSHRFPFYTNFSHVLSQDKYKTKTIVQYLKQQFKKMASLGQNYNKQKLTLKRKVIIQSMQEIVEQFKNKPMLKPIIAHDKESIQQYYGDIKVDFANKFIGGGALHQGCVQEQIMFANHPQMYSSVLFCQMMKQNQAIQFVGYKKYFKNKGYGLTLQYGGVEQHDYQYDEQGRAKQKIVAIDALHYPKKKHQIEFSIEKINRELLKAYAGFKCQKQCVSKIVSGGWGCGVFNGDLQLKFIIQWISCSLAGKQFIYIPFGQRNKILNQKLHKKISQITVGQLYKVIKDHPQEIKEEKNIYRFLQSKLNID